MNKQPLNVLVFPAGTETGMEIQRSLAACKEVRLFGATSGSCNHAEYVFERCYEVKDVRFQGWLDDLNKVIENECIEFVFPAHAYVLEALSKRRDELSATLVAASEQAISITRSKRRTLAALRGSIPTPRIFSGPEEAESFPVFVKPDNAYGSQGATEARSLSELKDIIKLTPEPLIQQFLPGPEVTCDCFSDINGQLLFARARYRQRIRMGTSMRSEFLSLEDNELFVSYARTISEKIGIAGAWFFQMKADQKGTYSLLEVEARIAGTMCLNRVAGVNFALLSLFIHSGKSFEIRTNAGEVVVDRALTNRYRHNYEYETVYLDLDDTLVVHGKVNVHLVSFIYQAINEGKRVVLISKSLENDKEAFLRKHRLQGLFDKVVWLAEADSKADEIAHKNAIFIDDSFSQRMEVADKCGIPTFDPSMVEILLNAKA